MLDPAYISCASLVAEVAMDLIPPLVEVVDVHRVHIGADQEQHRRVVHAIARVQPKSTLAHYLTGRNLQVLRVARYSPVIQVGGNLCRQGQHRASTIGALSVSHESLAIWAVVALLHDHC